MAIGTGTESEHSGKGSEIMRIAYHRRRLADFWGGMRLSRELAGRERWPKERLREYQQQRLEAIVRHAAEHSPFYRERLSGVIGSGPIELSSLPAMDKTHVLPLLNLP
jgi:phenylacetate-coenzyme A ligase PaaK-like adenylate-forming protein